MNGPRKTTLAEGRVHLPRVADVVADRIRELIVTGELKDGARLPRLEVLLDEFGVSGPSMREALRMLEAEGLITVQRGSIGGAVVHRPDARTAASTLATVMRSRGAVIGEVFEAMALVEPMCAMLCARRPDRKKVARELRELCTSTHDLVDGDPWKWNEAMSAFHKAVVQHSGNEALTLVVGALESILLVHVRAWAESTMRDGSYPDPSFRSQNLECHETLCDLIEAGDDLEAARVMARHIESYLHLFYENGGMDPKEPVSMYPVRAGD